MTKQNIIKIIFSLLLTPFFIACSGSKPDATTSTSGSTFTDIYNNILNANCVQCHSTTGHAHASTPLDFTSQSTAYLTLVGTGSVAKTVQGISSNAGGQCAGVPLVHPTGATDSYLMATLFSDYAHSPFYNSTCAPYSYASHGATVSQADKANLAQWIQSGAFNN